ncbi:cupin domain-containing protein [Marinomonas epiphytica]
MLNMDFHKTIMINTHSLDWSASPMVGVYRKPLAREEVERGHATSIVRYEAGSVFRSHPHPLGEEILVLEGTFSDEYGDFPAGSYFRNPPGTSHAPHSRNGCLLLVKLHQFQVDDLHQSHSPCADLWLPGKTEYRHLHQLNSENVWLIRTNTQDQLDFESILSGFKSVELFVIKGALQYSGYQLTAGCWLREPSFQSDLLSTLDSSLVWLKAGHF